MDVKSYRSAYEAELAAAEAPIQAEATADSPVPELLTDLPKLLEQLGNEALALAIRVAALRGLRAAMFLGDQFAPYRAQFLDICRKLARPEVEAPLREGATEVLAAEKDPDIQQQLRKDVSAQKSNLVGPVKALQLLSLDDHANVVELARDVFAKTADLGLKEAALRVLAVDPKSHGLLTQLLRTRRSPRASVR